MITIITGIPGMGKTASLVEFLLENDKQGLTARPVFVMGVPDLKLDHAKVPPISEWTEKRPDPDDSNLLLDYYRFPQNSILVIDEAQRVFPARINGSKPPPITAALATHRHTGLDIILLTQKPMQMDNWVKELAGRHIHIKPTILGRYLYEWPEYQDPNSKTNLADAAKRKFSPPKKVFNLYKSAEAHTKQPRRFHQIYIILILALTFVSFMAYRLYNGLYKRLTNDKPVAETIQETPTTKINPEQIPVTLPTVTQTQTTNNSPPAPPPEPVHPYLGFTFHIKATIKSESKSITYYELIKDKQFVFTNSNELKQLGYSINQPNECSSFLFFNGAQIVATCSRGDSPEAGALHQFANSTKSIPSQEI